MEIRQIQIGDAENVLNLMNKLEAETTYLLYEKDEVIEQLNSKEKTYKSS